MNSVMVMHDLMLVSPLLVLTAGSLLILLIEVFAGDVWPRGGVAVATLLAALLCVHLNWGGAAGQVFPGQTVFSGVLFSDPLSFYLAFLIIAGTAFVLLMSKEQLAGQGVESPGEFYSLALMSTIGAIIFVSAAELVTLFLGLEIMSMALYCLCGSALRSQRSSESALKYFFLGSFSSAFLLYGIALVYGLTGSMELTEIAARVGSADGPLLYVAIALMAVGFIFKIGAVPFHFWAPDVYAGAPTSVTMYMACVIKAAAFGALLRVFWIAFRDIALVEMWSGIVWYVAFFTMVLGNLVALRQRNVKRMLAYSSIGHAGYMLVAFVALSPVYGGGAAILFYLVTYTVMTLGAFGVVMAVSAAAGEGEDADDITSFNSLSRRSPMLAALMTLFMLSMAGLPPGMAGLLGKFYVFNAAVKAGYVGIAIVGVLCSAVSCYYYLRVIVAMYFVPEEGDVSEIGPVSFALNYSLKICAAAVVLLGIFPSAVYDRSVQIITQM